MQKHWEVTAIWRSGFPSTVYMWTVNIVRASKRPSEMFQTLMEKAYYSWNVFLGAPDILCECWKIWGIFVCLYQETCEQRDSQHLQLTWRERCSSQARTCLCKKNKEKLSCKKIKNKNLWRFDKEKRCRIPFTRPRIFLFFFFLKQLISYMTCAQCKANQFFPLISEIICPSRRRLRGFS